MRKDEIKKIIDEVSNWEASVDDAVLRIYYYLRDEIGVQDLLDIIVKHADVEILPAEYEGSYLLHPQGAFVTIPDIEMQYLSRDATNYIRKNVEPALHEKFSLIVIHAVVDMLINEESDYILDALNSQDVD